MNDLTEPDQSEWSRLFRVHKTTWKESSTDTRNVFELVADLWDQTIETKTQAAGRDRRVTQKKILTLIDSFRRDMLGHPINIILSAFLVNGSEPLWDYDRTNVKERDAKTFLETFPYDYLAAVYKQAFDYVVRKKTIIVTPKSMSEDQENIQTFLHRAKFDVKRVS